MKKKRKRLLKTTLLVSGLIAVVTTFFSFAILEPRFKIYGWETLDDNKLVKTQNTLDFFDLDGNNITDDIADFNKETVDISEISQHTIDAFVSIEDKRFYKHKGVDYIRIFGALFNNLKSLSFKEGASTISQQLIKNTHLNGDKKISRKIKEIRIAKELERKYSKDEIMKFYLNMLYFGDNMYGIKTASKVFFDKNPDELSISQSALLAGIINNPAKFNPYKNPDNAKARRKIVLTNMLNDGKITKKEYDNAVNEDLILNKTRNRNQYLNSIIKDAHDILGLTKTNLLNEKLNITTYYDRAIESDIESIIEKVDIPTNANCHVVVQNNKNASLIADVSLLDENLSYLYRMPGSVIKPLICYAPALENGDIYCCSQIEDVPTSFNGYNPSNYKNKYYGWVSAETALAQSLNIPAVKLLQSNGIPYSKSICEKAGIEFDKRDNNLALALGGMTHGVTLRQLADSYRIFSCRGNYIKGNTIKEIRDSKGNLIYRDRRKESSVISDDTAFLMSTMLKKCAETGTAKRLSGFDNVCAKTGTVGDKTGNTDLYCVAYSPNYTVAVHIFGTKDTMSNSITAGNYACSVASKVFALLKDNDVLIKPNNVKCRYVDNKTLKEKHEIMLAGNNVELKDKHAEWFSERYTPPMASQYDDYLDYDDLLNLDFDNFEIIDGFFD